MPLGQLEELGVTRLMMGRESFLAKLQDDEVPSAMERLREELEQAIS